MKSTERNWEIIEIRMDSELDSFGKPSISIYHRNKNKKCNGHIRATIKEVVADVEKLLRRRAKSQLNYVEPSPTSQTSPNGDFPNEKEHNISLKDNSNELSQISSNDETSLNNN
jgi:hypothetical protein